MTSRPEAIEKINDMIGNIKVAMLTTVDEDGDFHSRPMVTQEHHFDGDVWFFADRSSDKVREIEQNASVNVAYVEDGNFVSIAGKARIISDVSKKQSLWHESLRVWFEQGPESAEVILIHVDAESAQYWDTPSGALGKAVNAAKVVLTGDKNEAGDSEKVDF